MSEAAWESFGPVLAVITVVVLLWWLDPLNQPRR